MGGDYKDLRLKIQIFLSPKVKPPIHNKSRKHNNSKIYKYSYAIIFNV